MLERVTHLLPPEMAAVLGRLPDGVKDRLEEIRVREGRPLEIGFGGESRFAGEDGSLRHTPEQAYRPSSELCRKMLERMTNHSLYAMEEELRRGYITVSGGHRIGLCGRTVLERGTVRGIRDIGGFNIRIAREVVGAADGLLPQLADRTRGTIVSTLVLAPPQQGKTTLIRDLARSISYGLYAGSGGMRREGRKVAIVDERSEIAACVRGVPTFDVGPRTDVMDACPKAEGMMMMLRSMSPDVLVVDEIGHAEDAAALREAVHAGVSVIATAHARDLQDARDRPALRELIEEGAFAAFIELRRTAEGFRSRVLRPGPGALAREPTALQPERPLC